MRRRPRDRGKYKRRMSARLRYWFQVNFTEYANARRKRHGTISDDTVINITEHTDASLTASGEGGIKTTGALSRCSGALLTKAVNDEEVVFPLSESSSILPFIEGWELEMQESRVEESVDRE